MLKRLKGALAALAGCAALDPLYARRSDAITTNGRMRRATVRRGFEVLDAVASAIPTPALTRLAACIAVFAAVSLPTPSALAAYPWSASPESEIFDSVAATVETRGVIRPGTASKAITNARPSAETVGTCAVAPYRWHISLWRAGSRLSIHGAAGPLPSAVRSLFKAMRPWSTERSNGSQKPR